MTLVYVAIAWTVGLALGARLALPAPVLVIGSLSALAVLVLEQGQGRRQRMAALTLVALLGAWRWQLAQPRFGPIDLASYNDRGRVVVEGHVSAEPSIRSTRTQLELTVARILLDGKHLDVRGKAVVSAPHYPAHEYGQRVRISGNLETPPILEDFNYREYLAARGVHSLMRWATIEALPGRAGNPVLGALYRLKATLRKRIDLVLPHPEAGLLQGILLGLDHTLPPDLAEAFRMAGLTHIIVVSGHNVSVLLQAWFFGSLRWMHRRASQVAGLALLGLFVALIGPSPPVVRAGLTGGLFVMAQLAGRRASPLASLAATALIMTGANPLLLHSVSYQLSFAATLALILLQPRLVEGWYSWLRPGAATTSPWMRSLWETLLTTTAAQIATMPIIWANFGELSTVALLANALVLPLQPLILILGALVTLVSLPTPGLARLLGYVLWLPLRWSTGVACILSELPGASVLAPQAPEWLAWLFYAALLLVVVGRPLRRIRIPNAHPLNWRSLVIPVALALAVVLIWATAVSLPDGRLRIYALDVGQGDALLIRSPQGHVVVIDGGPDPVVMSARLGQVLPFWERRIDLIVATHQDADHLAGLLPLVERYQVGQIVQGGPATDSLLSAEWQRRLDAGEVTARRVKRGDVIHLGETRLRVLHPATDLAHNARDDNDGSVVILLEHGGFRMLFTGDIGALTEAELLAAEVDLAATVLKVPHHGSETSSTAGFLAQAAPQVCLISVGNGNRFGHPSEQVLQRLEAAECQVLRTDQHGTIELATDGRQLWVRTGR